MFVWFAEFLHSFPRFNFSFSAVTNTFDPSESQYLQGVGIWALFTLCLCLLLLLIVCIVWSVRCCRKSALPTKRTGRVRKLSVILFLISICCFACLGFGLFGNERVNRGVESSLGGFQDINENLGLSATKLSSMQTVLATNVTGTLEKLAVLISKESPKLNQTMLNQIHGFIRNVSEDVDSVNESLAQINQTMIPLVKTKRASQVIDRIEGERWLIFVILLSVTIVVLFGGVVGFCRHSKKAAVVFSGLGIVIYLVCWLLLSIVVVLSLGVSDFCVAPDTYVEKQFKLNSTQDVAKYYFSCNDTEGSNLAPEILEEDMTSMEENISELNVFVQNLNTLLTALFPSSPMSAACTNITNALSSLSMDLGALRSYYACSSFHSDCVDVETGLCHSALIGFSVVLVGLILLDVFLFVLLLVISKAWHLYSHRPIDYVEVDEEDPFVPRQERSNIPVDIYGTHVYNPRTRFASAGDSDGNETNANNTPLWQRGAPPPAYDSVGVTQNQRRNR